MDTYRIYGPAAGSYEGAYTVEEAHHIAEKYELFGRASWIVQVSADGKKKTIISDGTQARRVITCWGKDPFRRVKILEWWLSCYSRIQAEIKCGSFVADSEIMQAQIAIWREEKAA